MRRIPVLLLSLAFAVLTASAVCAGSLTGFTLEPVTPAPSLVLVSDLLAAPEVDFGGSTISSFGEKPKGEKKNAKKGKHEPAPAADEDVGLGLGAERAQILLRSLTVPGWGQATLGHRHAAAFFGTIELGVWTAFTAFHIQEAMRTESSLRSARLDAGIDLHGRDDEFRRIVGAFASSDEYNLFVVTRDAANLFLNDVNAPDISRYRAYIAEHSLKGKDAWAWSSNDTRDRYAARRKDANRASLRANTALGIAIANRLVSALHASRAAGRAHRAPAHSWNFEITPAPGVDPTAFRAGVSASF